MELRAEKVLAEALAVALAFWELADRERLDGFVLGYDVEFLGCEDLSKIGASWSHRGHACGELIKDALELLATRGVACIRVYLRRCCRGSWRSRSSRRAWIPSKRGVTHDLVNPLDYLSVLRLVLLL